VLPIRLVSLLLRLVPIAVVGCRVLPPPPVLPPHASTETDREGATTAVIVVGIAHAGELFDGNAWGVALRVEHQQTERTTLGLELTGGRGDEARYESGEVFRPWLVGARAYGRFAPSSTPHDLAFTYGAGLSLMATGLVTGTLHGGLALGYANDHAVPVGALGLALAVPLRPGRPYGDPHSRTHYAFGAAEPDLNPGRAPLDPGKPRTKLPATELYLGFDLGLIVPIGKTGNRLSADFGFARAIRDKGVVLALSLGEAQRFDP